MLQNNETSTPQAIEPLACVASDTLQASCTSEIPQTIGQLERALLEIFPAQDAESWDRSGLLVGDRSAAIERVALALDPTVAAIKQAALSGANVLITHHPVFLSAPEEFTPLPSSAVISGAAVYEAIRLGVALICFHTTLDVSVAAQHALPSLLHLQYQGVLQPLAHDATKGYGQVCLLGEGSTVSAAEFGARCTAVFGRAPRLWGNPQKTLRSVVTCTGSAGDTARAALAAGADALVCGEVKYHEALEVSQAGLIIFELGHDVSELPLVSVLAAHVQMVGIPPARLIILDQSFNWTYPDSIRL